MKVALVGATGFIGQHILKELASRQHQVTALVRHPEKVPSLSGVTPKALEVEDLAALAQALAGHDAAVLSFHYLNTNFAALIADVMIVMLVRECLLVKRYFIFELMLDCQSAVHEEI